MMNVEILSDVAKFIEQEVKDEQSKERLLKRLSDIEKYGINKLLAANEAERFKQCGIDEIKVRGKIQYRLFGALIRGTYWILHGFIKKTQKTEKRNKRLACKRKKNLENS